MSLIETLMGQPDIEMLPPIDEGNDDRLLGGVETKIDLPVVHADNADRKTATSANNNVICIPEYVVDRRTKTTYLKGKFLGKGGFAVVHEFTDLTNNKVYAGKIIPKSRISKPHQKEKILREIDLHRPLQHKHVVRFHHYFENEDNVYIILEYCPRKSLVHILDNRRILTEPEVRYFMLQLVEGVRYIHSQGVIHRDLKLGNMLLSEDMEIKIADFGLASKIGGSDTTGHKFSVCGTPNYIAPEVLGMKGHGFPADVWGMGCTMYAMLVGHPPFETHTIGETYSRIASNKYTIPSHLSNSARNLISKMLKSKPVDRPNLNEILQHEFFYSGLLPQSLPTTCCVAAPKFTAAAMVKSHSKLSTVDPFSDVEKVTNTVTELNIHPQLKVESSKPKTELVQKKDFPKKEIGFQSTLVTFCFHVLCPDKNKKNKMCSSSSLYHMLLNCLKTMPKDGTTNPPPVPSNGIVFITKWIDYSNKYGFGFQLSDHSVGVVFADGTSIGMAPDQSRIEFHDTLGKLSVHSPSSVPTHLQERYILLKYFAKYMDENLTEGGNLQSGDLVKKKGSIPCVIRWIRTPNAIVMQLSTGTLQINFFKDHTKIVISGQQLSDGLVLYINEDRQTSTYSLEDIALNGCDPSIHTRLQYALSVLQEFIEIEDSN